MDGIYRPELEGVIAAITSISNIEPGQGRLEYRGYDIRDLTERSTFEEVAFLLLYGRLPQMEELTAFSNDLSQNRDLPEELIGLLYTLPAASHPMDILHAAIVFLGALDPEARDFSREAQFRKATRTIAKLPTAIAMSWRIVNDQDPVTPMRRLSHAENFLYMLSGYRPDKDAVTALDRVLILYAEHASDVSSFTARVAASSCTDYHSAIAAAIASLKGKLDGGESEQAMRQLQLVRQADQVEKWMHAAVSNNQPIIGFGHPVYKHGDASAQIMKTVSRELGEKTGDLRWHELCEQIEEFMLQKNLYHTVNFYSGPVLALLGVPAALCTPIFAAGRIAGWSAHVIEQLENNWVFRPRFKYRGPKNLSYIPLGSRSSKINGTFLLQKQATVSEKQH